MKSLNEVHQKLRDPEESRRWLGEALEAFQGKGEADLQHEIGKGIEALPEQPAPEPPEGWERLSEQQQAFILNTINGHQALSSEADGQQLESATARLLKGELLRSPYALWVWQVLLRRADLAEENQVRHWVDAEERNLKAFEARYELWETLRTMPGTMVADPEEAWKYLEKPENLPPRKPLRKQRLYFLVPLILSAVLTCWGVHWYISAEGDPVAISSNIVAIPVGVRSEAGMEGKSWQINGRVDLLVNQTDSLSLWESQIQFFKGEYRLEASEDHWQATVISGKLLLTTPRERFRMLPGEILSRHKENWYKMPE